MKSEINVAHENNISHEYPCLKFYKYESKMKVVLFTNPRTGTVVNVINCRRKFESDTLGYYSTTWTEEDFTDFNGKITLSND